MVNIIQKIKEFFTNYRRSLREQVEETYFTSGNIEAVLPDSAYKEVVDDDYFTCNFQQMKKVCKMIPSRLHKYKGEFDCDDFAWEFKTICKTLFPRLPIGYVHADVIGGKHALNCCVYEFNGQPRFAYIEPQTGAMYNQIQGTKPYLIII